MKRDTNLNDLREKIRDIDATLLDLIAKRQDLARQVGQEKLAANIPIKNEKVEKEVLASVRQKADEIGIYEDLAEEVFRTLIDYSCKAQEDYQYQSNRKVPPPDKKILIVGGGGRMGQWFARFLVEHGHDIRVHDLRKPAHDLGESLREAHIVILATPISETANLIRLISKSGTKALVFDACSIKAPILEAIAEAKSAGIRITSIHPLFGPQVTSLAGRNILFCQTGNDEWTEEASSLFCTSAAAFKFLPLEKHDDYMGYILGLSHLINLIFSGVLADSGSPFSEFASTGSTTFNAQAKVSAMVSRENQDLYYEIQVANSATGKILKGLKEVLESYTDRITRQDKEGFKKLMDKGNRYFTGGG